MSSKNHKYNLIWTALNTSTSSQLINTNKQMLLVMVYSIPNPFE